MSLGRADARPRIHIWPHPNGVAWSIGPTGRRTPAPTRLAAMADGLAHLGEPEAFVIIAEGAP